MYVPSSFRGSDEDALSIMRAHPFATLTAIVDGEIVTAHAPLLTEGRAPRTVLIGHLARANPFVRALDETTTVHAHFHGPDAYVSPTWYATPSAQVPTWNYVAAHARGRARVIDARPALDALVDVHEGERAWRLEALEPSFVSTLTGAIVAFEIACELVEAKLKLSQNRSAIDRARVHAALANHDDAGARAVAAWMKARAAVDGG